MKKPTAARQRVHALLEVARSVADPSHPLGQTARQYLPSSSGLSSEGVELALTEYLECTPKPPDLNQLLARAEPAPHCHVGLAANVCTAALRALACALATAPTVTVRPSRRDPVLAKLLVEALSANKTFQDAEARISIVDQLKPDPGDAVHLYGSDDSIHAICKRFSKGIKVSAHGSGAGVAVVGRNSRHPETATALACDLVAFDGRGCLSPRWILVEDEPAQAVSFAQTLHHALQRQHTQVPRGALNDDELRVLANHHHTFQAIGEYFHGPSHTITFDPEPMTLPLPPPFRCSTVVPCTSETLDTLISPWLRYITAIGSAPNCQLAQQLRALAPHARQSALGEMQKPPLDGPVDQRVVSTTTS